MTGADPSSQPVLNTPYQKPARHWDLGIDNRATNRILERRRPSIALLPVPKSRENVGEQLVLGPENLNRTINEIRQLVDAWRDHGYQGATAVSRRLLHHWRSEDDVLRPFFSQDGTHVVDGPAISFGRTHQDVATVLEQTKGSQP